MEKFGEELKSRVGALLLVGRVMVLAYGRQ